MLAAPERSRVRTNRFVLLFLLYIAQSIPANFFISAFPILLREGGASLQYIGLLNLLFLPTVLRPLWAPTVDRRGTYKQWIMVLQVVCVVLMWSLHNVDFVKMFAIMYAIAFAYATASATQDIAVDALTVRVLKPNERATGGGIRTAGLYLGTIVGAGGLLILYERIGFAPVVGINTAILALPLVALAFFPMPKVEARETATLKSTLRFFKRPGIPTWCLVLAAFNVGTVLSAGMTRPLLVDHGVTNNQMGVLFGFVNPVLSILGCAVAPRVIRWLGRWRSLVAFCALMALENALYLTLLPKTAGITLVFGVFGLIALTQGFPGVLLFTVMQDKCAPGTEGTDFSLQISMNLVGIMIAGSASGFLAAAMGYRGLFVVALGVQLAMTAAVAFFVPARMLEPEKAPAAA
jgi:predicted MFS family arabinose efflux permease